MNHVTASSAAQVLALQTHLNSYAFYLLQLQRNGSNSSHMLFYNIEPLPKINLHKAVAENTFSLRTA